MERRTVIATGIGLTVASRVTGAADVALKETDIDIKTPDGTADAVLVHPAEGTHPGILVWTDIRGLRPAYRDMAKRIAAAGYSVLVPNPFYRAGRAPIPGPGADFNNPADRAVMMQLMGAITPAGVAERDAGAYLAYLDGHAAVKKSAKLGVTGYCMGGPLSMRTAALRPDRIAAAASFHGGSLVTDKPDSPHLKIPAMKAQFYFGVASDDDEKEPNVKTILKDAYAAANLKAEIEVYPGARHGWCVPGGPVYNHEAAERAMGKLLGLLKTALA
jgi:carboxymethylenebutenolidase